MIDAESDPEPGSVVASAVKTGASPVSGRSQASFCSSVPSARIGSAKNPFEHTKFPMPGSPKHSCSWTRHWVKTSVNPPPPYSSGIMKSVMPSFAAWPKSPTGDSVSASSTARAAGRICSRRTSGTGR